MVRVGTLLDEFGRPKDKVQIIRRGKINTRILRSTDYGRSWATDNEQVPSDRILLDDGRQFAQHSHNPQHATYVDNFGKPAARLRIHRVYPTVTKAKVYLGDKKWTPIQDIATNSILFDGGASAGWVTPSWLEPSPAKDEQDRRQDDQTQEEALDLAPSATAPAPPKPPTTQPTVQKFSYIRVSSADQNLGRQREMIGPVDKEFLDKLSARSRSERPGCVLSTSCLPKERAKPGHFSSFTRHVSSVPA